MCELFVGGRGEESVKAFDSSLSPADFGWLVGWLVGRLVGRLGNLTTFDSRVSPVGSSQAKVARVPEMQGSASHGHTGAVISS